MTSVAAISVSELSRVYVTKRSGGQTVRRTALDELTLSINQGELFGLLGPNGAGKTTLIKILSTMLLPSSGTARLLGYDVVKQAHEVRKKIGVVLGGERGLYYRLTAREILTYWAAIYGLSSRHAQNRIDELLVLVGLSDRTNDRVETLSRGMKQRLHLARGLIGSPQVLFLDEPTSGLDPTASDAFHNVIKSLQSAGVTILLTTHDMREAESLCDRVAFINDGHIILIDTPQALVRLSSNLEVIVAELPDPEFASGSLLCLSGVLETELINLGGVETVRLTVDTVANIPAVIKELGSLGAVRVFSQVPTLHDVYIRLTNTLDHRP